MRFVWAVVAFIVAAVMIGAGIAQRTVFQGPDTAVESVANDDAAAFTLVDGAALNALPGTQTLTVEGDGTVFVAYGRTADVQAWLADQTYTAVTLSADETAESAWQTTLVEPEAPVEEPAAEGDEESTGEESTAAEESDAGRSPVGSDLWLDEFQEEGTLSTSLQLPDTMSLVIASDGTAPAPAEVTVAWPIEQTTPWSGPLIVGGVIVLAVGVFLYILGIRHVRRSRGPRRKGLPMPKTEPIDLSVEGEDKGVVSATPTRKSLGGAGRRRLVAVPAVGLAAVLMAGCSADAWPDLAASPTPSGTPTVIVPEGQQAPAVTEVQAERIIERISTIVAEADENRDADLAATRLAGAALSERETNYTLRGEVDDQPTIAAIPSDPVSIVLPQAVDGWPRTVMMVVEDGADDTVAPTVLTMSQEDPWSDYKVTYVAGLEASTRMPDLAAPYVGATQVPPDSSFLIMRPDELSAAYADLINNGEDSEYWDDFDTDSDLLLAGIQANKQSRLDELNETGADTAELTFEATAGEHDPVSLATLESGAIVAVDVYENDEVTPTDPDAVIKLDNNPAVQALTGIEESASGFRTTYADQLFFYVPAQGSSEKIRLLGYRSNLLDATEIDE